MRRQPLLVMLLAAGVVAVSGIEEGVAGTTIRGHRVGGHGHSSHHHGSHNHHHGTYGHYGYYGGVGFAGYYGYYHPGPYYYAAYPYAYPWYPSYAYSAVYSSPIGYIDTDVTPEDAAVFVDGEYVGVADNFDGYPRYFSIEPGKHTVTFKLDGYKSWTRTVRVGGGGITRLKFRLQPGEGADEAEPATAPEGAGLEDAVVDWEEEPGGSIDLPPDPPGDPGFVRLNVSPPEASVYLDGKFYAPASTLGRLHGDLRLESGVHVIEVVMPGYETSSRRIELAPGDRLELSIELRKTSR